MISTDNQKERYFIAIAPTGRVQDLIQGVKEDIYQKYGLRGAFRSSGHITLQMPFTYKSKKLNLLFDLLESFCSQTNPFKIQLKNFDCFAPRVVFISVVENEILNDLHKQLSKRLRTLQLFNQQHKRGFNPHITVAFRGLKKDTFKALWYEYQSKKFEETFLATKIVLYKHTETGWNEYKYFNFNQK